MSKVHYTTKGRAKTTIRDLFFMIGSGLAFVSLFLALILPVSCKGTRQIFVVCSGSYTSPARAEERAAAMQRMGGGGFVLQRGMYLVLSAAYVSEKDCDSVVENLGSEHAKLALEISECYDDVARVTRSLSEIYYALDTGSSDPETSLQRAREFAARETLPQRLESPRREQLAAVLDKFKALGTSSLSVNLKYLQLEIISFFVK